MSTELVIPDYLKDMMASVDVPKTEDMVSGGMSTPRISLKGSRFRFKEGGEEIEILKDDLDCVIVGVVPEQGTAKTFYEGAYNPESSDPPDCSSTNGMNPDSWITNPISNNCNTCPNNKFGSAISMSGKKSKACRDSRRLYIVRASEMKEKKPKAWLLSVTVSSLKDLTNYSRDLARSKIPSPSVVITRISFDPDSEFPKIQFKVLGILNEAMAKTSLAIASEKEWDVPISTVSKAIAQDKRDIQALPIETVDINTGQGADVSASESVDDILSNW